MLDTCLWILTRRFVVGFQIRKGSTEIWRKRWRRCHFWLIYKRFKLHFRDLNSAQFCIWSILYLTFSDQISALSKYCFCHIRQLRCICPYLDSPPYNIDTKIFLCLHSSLYLLVSWAWWDWPLTWLTNHRLSVLWHCWLGHVTRKIVSEMTYNVSSGTLNSTIPNPYLDGKTASTIATSIVHSKLECLCHNLPNCQLNRLQQIQNSLACAVVVKAPKSTHIIPILKSLQWLKVNERIDYKLLSVTYKYNHST